MRVRSGVWVVVALVAMMGALAVEYLTGITPYVRDRVAAGLNARFASEVDFASLRVSTFPRPAIAATGLTLRHNGRRDVPPLIAIDAFSASAGLLGLGRTPLRLKTVDLAGLRVHLPAGGLDGGDNDAHGPGGALFVERIVSRAAALEIASKNPSKLPRRFEIYDLEMLDFGGASGSPFRASLTNPTPRGRIDTEGTFGPWHASDPRLTPVRGDYLFGGADLDTIKGIGGTLSSAGAYSGVLERIEVTGHTETPDFSLDVAGRPVPLTTEFTAVVDGTNGDTRLERVEATLHRTTVLARGAVVRSREVKGRQVSLDVTIRDGHLEDLLALAVKTARTPIVGQISLQTRLVIPAGQEDVVDKLQLDGAFDLASARFTNVNVQERINTLSRRGRGDAAGAGGESVVSNLRGRFTMRDATIRFSELTFAVPGAVVRLAGRYELRSEAMDFAGDLLLDGSLAQMTTGIKSVAARIAQPFFRRPGGGSKLPIRISGTREQPSFGLDIRRSLLPG